jgi:hypothetical protein
MTSAELSYQNLQRCEEISNRLEKYAELNPLLSQIESIQERFSEECSKIHELYTPLSHTERLQQNTEDYIARINRLEQAISQKMERSELYHLELLAKELRNFERNHQELEGRIETIERERRKREDLMERERRASEKKIEDEIKRTGETYERELKRMKERDEKWREETRLFHLSLPKTYATIVQCGEVRTFPLKL